jgi:hypothetical protein
MAGAGFHSIAKLRTQLFNPVLAVRGVFQADCQRENCRTADCQSQESELESGMPKAWNARRVCIRPESRGWQSAEHWKADCQGDNIVVAVRGIRARRFAMEWNPAPAILHGEAPFLNCHIFLKSDFTSLKLILGVLFRPNLNNNCLSWHTISWHYTFKTGSFVKTRIRIWSQTYESATLLPDEK